jgi:hypothetical protein
LGKHAVRWLAQKLMEESVNLKLSLDVHVSSYPILNDEALIIAHIWFQHSSHCDLWYMEIPEIPDGSNFVSSACLGMSTVFRAANSIGIL